MKISFEKKIILGFVINLIVVLALGAIYWNKMSHATAKLWDWIALGVVLLSVGMLTAVYFIIRVQLKEKNESKMELSENKKLLQSIIDNTTNPISVKKINGEYLFINKQYESLFYKKDEKIIGKTDQDFLPKEIADRYRSTDLEAVKEGKEIKVEEIIEQSDGPHTYLAVKFPLLDASNRIYAVGSIATDISERKVHEESLAALNTLFTMSQDLLCIASDEYLLKTNPAATKILGFSEEELKEKPFLDFVHPDDVESTIQEVSKLQTGATTVNFENRYLCKDGSYKWLNWTTHPDVETNRLYAVARDVTSKKEYQKSLKAGDTFFEISLDILVIVSEDMLVKINPSLSKALGYSELELKSKPFTTYVFPEDLKATEEEIEKLKKGTPLVNFRNRWMCKDGTIKWLSWTGTLDAATHTIYAIARDITEQLKLEQEEQQAIIRLHKSEQQLTMILENIGDGVLVADAKRKVVMANHVANELFGKEDDSTISVNFSDQFELFYPDEKTTFPMQNLPMERALEREITDDIDIVLWNPTSQEKKRVLLSGRPLVDKENNVVAAVITIKDITRYKKMEEELENTELKYRRAIGFKIDDDDEEKLMV